MAIGTNLHLFGDLGYRATDDKSVPNTFFLGSLDMLVTSRLSDRVSILGEVLYVPQSDNSIGLDIERLLFQYRQNDYFSFGVGRFHTSIGYYNFTFHRGAWFETAIGRPFMYAFDDEGGVLPMQEVGVTVHGKIPSGMLDLNYIAEIGNGRAHILSSDPAQNRQDTNNGKSVNVAVFARPYWVPGLQAGFSFYHDHLTFSDADNHPEYIMAAHVVYRTSVYEFLNEGLWVRHDLTAAGGPGIFHTTGFYSQISRKFGDFRPYFRYDYMNARDDDPIYGDPTDGTVVGRRNGVTVGLRYDFNERSAVKLQYDRLDQRNAAPINGMSTQFSFTF